MFVKYSYRLYCLYSVKKIKNHYSNKIAIYIAPLGVSQPLAIIPSCRVSLVDLHQQMGMTRKKHFHFKITLHGTSMQNLGLWGMGRNKKLDVHAKI